MDIYLQAVSKIIKAQEAIIGPLAYEQAADITGITVNSKLDIKLDGDGKIILGNLVKKYSEFFGQASIEVCKEAVDSIDPHPTPEELPDILR